MVTAARTPLAVTMGDPAGIGGEITLKAWAERHNQTLPPFFLLDDPARMAHLASSLSANLYVQEITSPAEALDVWDEALPVLSIGMVPPTTLGHSTIESASAILRSIDMAVELVQAGDAAAVVTNPIQKSTLYAQGFTFQGHTDYIASLCVDSGTPPTPVMMLAAPELRVVPVTVHEALAAVPQSLTTGMILETARITAKSLQMDFGVAQPRLAVCGLNPHAGEGGTMGDEELRLIQPAIDALRAEGLHVSGPHAADSLFHAAARERYDVAICMYHDQALIPIKTIAFDHAVNVTLGLPIVRTSPDHGTALDIAGKGIASPLGLIAALKLAAEMAERRSQ